MISYKSFTDELTKIAEEKSWANRNKGLITAGGATLLLGSAIISRGRSAKKAANTAKLMRQVHGRGF